MNAQRAANDIIDYIRQHILPGVARGAELQTPEAVWELRSQLHALHHYCMRSGLPDDLPASVEGMLSTSEGFWNLLSENEVVAMDIRGYTKARTLSAGSEGFMELEEWISGEDTFRDVLIYSVGFMLNWKANTLWIDSVKRTQRAMTKNYLLELQDRIWQFIKESARNTGEMDIERANEIRQRADGFMRLIRDGELTTEAQIGLLMQIYILLLRLQLGKLIIRLEEIRGV